jgi:hypothetical protein
MKLSFKIQWLSDNLDFIHIGKRKVLSISPGKGLLLLTVYEFTIIGLGVEFVF